MVTIGRSLMLFELDDTNNAYLRLRRVCDEKKTAWKR